jgi:hypothetical protein
LKRLLTSITSYNTDEIPFYISTPENQYQDLIAVLGTSSGFYWVSDESIIAANPLVPVGIEKTRSGGLSQQVIKSEFWRLSISENYLCIDSDSKFICSFKKADFVTDDNVPYTVLHQNKELFQMASNRGHQKFERDLKVEAERVRLLFNRPGPNFYAAPSPFNWSAKVWQSLDQEYLQPRGITIWDLITSEHPESLIYAEALLKYRAIPLVTIEPLFRVYHYDWQYFLMKRLGESESKLAQHYLGVIYQSAWDLDNQIDPSNKSLPSRALRRIKRFGRYLQSYF